jgi:hypothetical protein
VSWPTSRPIPTCGTCSTRSRSRRSSGD